MRAFVIAMENEAAVVRPFLKDGDRLYVEEIEKDTPALLSLYHACAEALGPLQEAKADDAELPEIDSAALHDLYGVPNKPEHYSLTMKTPEDYSSIKVTLQPFVPHARIQVISAQDKILREMPAREDGTLFQYLKPDTYYLRMYIDENGDGEWTTGSWSEKRQPERLFYFPEKIQTKSNWDFEELWNYTAVGQTDSKPRELSKPTTMTKRNEK